VPCERRSFPVATLIVVVVVVVILLLTIFDSPPPSLFFFFFLFHFCFEQDKKRFERSSTLPKDKSGVRSVRLVFLRHGA
jgi:hypothetical protein